MRRVATLRGRQRFSRGWWRRGSSGSWFKGRGETKWGGRDNDNVRSALAGGLLRLMDALIISKQELQCFALVRVCTCKRFRCVCTFYARVKIVKWEHAVAALSRENDWAMKEFIVTL